jgi:hypothetical protein
VNSSFLLISALLLILIACGLVFKPVPIEPAEKEKRMKKTGLIEKKKSFNEMIQSFIDFSLFYDLIFMYFAASNFLTSLGFNAPYIFIVDQSLSLGVEKHNADILLSTIGDTYFIFDCILTLRFKFLKNE